MLRELYKTKLEERRNTNSYIIQLFWKQIKGDWGKVKNYQMFTGFFVLICREL